MDDVLQPKKQVNGVNCLPDSIAIVGMAGRFPQARNIKEFWQNIQNGIDCVSTFSDDELELLVSDRALIRKSQHYVRKGAIVDDADCFDAQFFGLQPKDVDCMDPQHRLFLECSWHAIEDAGYDPIRYQGRIGVFASCYMNTYLLANLDANPEFVAGLVNSFHGGSLQTELGNDKDYLATRVAYKLNLRGPAMTIQTACSSSLVAVTQACQNLMTYQCDMALAGGVTLRFPQKRGYVYTHEGMVSPVGQCRTFDANAKGTIFGNGVGVVLLKRLEDALNDGDSIYALIKGWGLNNDGGAKYSYTAPSVDGQADVIALAQSLANASADSITYVEAHGTGTSLGDPIEVEALTKAFRLTTNNKQYCAIGSVKTNIGHLDCAAGIAGLIKTSLALHDKLLPPSLHFDAPNTKIDFPNTPFYVNTKLCTWPAGETPRRAGLSSFGVGGTNAHIVLEEAPQYQQQSNTKKSYCLFPLSAKSQAALKTMSINLAKHLQENENLNVSHVARTLQQGRSEFNHRRVVITKSLKEANDFLSEDGPNPLLGRVLGDNAPVIFMFPGQGSQHVNMGRDLYETEPVFRQCIDQCSEVLLPLLQFDIREHLYPNHRNQKDECQEGNDQKGLNEEANISQTLIAQPGIFITSYALAKLWMHWGIHPEVMIGHSIGEFVAGCLGGVFSLKDVLAMVVARAREMQELPTGSMLSIRLGEADVRQFLHDYGMEGRIDLAVINSPTLCVVSGATDVIHTLHAQLEKQHIISRLLHTSHAFHSHMMEPAVQSFRKLLQAVSLNPTTIPIMSTVGADWLSEIQATDPEYWARHLRKPVNFSGGIRELLKDGQSIFLEVGPGQTLSTLVKQHINRPSDSLILSSLPHAQQTADQYKYLLSTLGKLWISGRQIQWTALDDTSMPIRVHLPTYPFEKKRYWVEQKSPTVASDSSNINSPLTSVTGAVSSQITAGSHGIRPDEPDRASTQVRQGQMDEILQHQIEIMKQQLDTWNCKQ
ncbi:MAG: hypothetical protein NPIRA02_05220 [Nitrospirales bacterium]|nr:MAG: hypothetical protein NPIRA02_05220 [Nitrospirales bacterium]